MIYHFNIIIKDKKETRVKDFYLTAENKNDLYKRIQSQYATDKKDVEILEEIDERIYKS